MAKKAKPQSNAGKNTAEIGIIGGSGLYAMPGLRICARSPHQNALRRSVATRSFSANSKGTRRLSFAPRPRTSHSFPPKLITARIFAP